MIRKVSFESYERRIKQVLAALNENGIAIPFPQCDVHLVREE